MSRWIVSLLKQRELFLPAGDANTNQKEAISAVEGAGSAVASQIPSHRGTPHKRKLRCPGQYCDIKASLPNVAFLVHQASAAPAHARGDVLVFSPLRP